MFCFLHVLFPLIMATLGHKFTELNFKNEFGITGDGILLNKTFFFALVVLIDPENISFVTLVVRFDNVFIENIPCLMADLICSLLGYCR